MPNPGTFDDPKKKLTDDPGVTAPVVISAVSVSTGSGTATVTWTTSVGASSRIGYGVYPNRDQTTAETDTNPLVTSHSVGLTGLVAGKIYKIRVHSRLGGGKDGGNNAVMDGYNVYADGQFVAT